MQKYRYDKIYYLSYLYSGDSAFLAKHSAQIAGTRNLRFTSVTTNVGNDYDPSTGVYTCRIPGTDWIAAALGTSEGVVENTDSWILINGNLQLWIVWELNKSFQNITNPINTVEGYGAFHLNKGDRVQIGGGTTNIAAYAHSHFSGFLIRPDA